MILRKLHKREISWYRFEYKQASIYEYLQFLDHMEQGEDIIAWIISFLLKHSVKKIYRVNRFKTLITYNWNQVFDMLKETYFEGIDFDQKKEKKEDSIEQQLKNMMNGVKSKKRQAKRSLTGLVTYICNNDASKVEGYIRTHTWEQTFDEKDWLLRWVNMNKNAEAGEEGNKLNLQIEDKFEWDKNIEDAKNMYRNLDKLWIKQNDKW